MSLSLAASYMLGELLSLTSKGFVDQTVRRLLFVFSDGTQFSLEYTDARTQRIRYSKTQHQTTTVLSYSTLDKITPLILDVEKDIRNYAATMMSLNPEGRSSTVRLYLTNVVQPVVYNSRPGCFSYVKHVK